MIKKEFKSFYKEVKGNEGNKCNYPTRLDTYGCGCSHDCCYCYAKSLLDFRNLWDTFSPSVANIDKIKRKIEKLPIMPPIRIGGMTDCFQPCELKYNVTYETIKALNNKQQPYLIVTKSDIVASEKYLQVLDKKLAHIQITVTCTSDKLYKELDFEKAPLPSRRISAIEKLNKAGYDVQLRLSPFIPAFIVYDELAEINCDKILVEFLRINPFILRWFGKYINADEYTVKQSNYKHLPLETKLKLIEKVKGFKEITVCEDESEAWEYWNKQFNPNPLDCCNLRL